MNADGGSANVFAAAVQWLDGTLLGTMATALAVIAVASIGFLLMSGRVDVRRAAHVIVGCFILFGASSIASGIMRAVTSAGITPDIATAPPLPPAASLPAVAKAPLPAVPYDPYAGAALPSQR